MAVASVAIQRVIVENDEQEGTKNILKEERSEISAFLITYNEERNIRACLESISFCDEIVIIDSFSTDRTLEIAQKFGAKVIQRPWPGYREQKSFGLAATTKEWVLNLDADERVSPELQENILQVLREDYQKKKEASPRLGADISGYYINRVVFYLGRWWRRGGWYPEYRLRFFRRNRASWGGVDPHERALVEGETARLDGELQHFTYRNLGEQLTRLHHYATLAANEEFKIGNRATFSKLFFNPFIRIFKFFFLKGGFREGSAGLIVAIAEGYYTFMKYAKLWEMAFIAEQEKHSADERQDK